MKDKKNITAVINVLSVALLVGAIATSAYFYYQYKNATVNKEAAAKKEIESTVATVAKLMVLPADDTPTIATVADKSKLQNQEFFSLAENGDKVLIYTKSKKAILYRPSINKIIDVAPVRTVDPADQQGGQEEQGQTAGATTTNKVPAASPTPVKKAGVTTTMYNGTDTQGLTFKIEQPLKTRFNIEINARQEAVKKDYAKTLVIDISGDNTELVQEMAAFLNADISSLPEGEVTPTSDILVIIGSDKK